MAWTSDIKRKKRQKTETKTLRRRLFLAQCWLRGQFKTNQLFLDKCSRTRALPDGNFPKAVQDIGVIVEIPLCKKLPKKLHQFHRWFRRRKRTRNFINLTELSLQNLIAWQKKGVTCSKRHNVDLIFLRHSIFETSEYFWSAHTFCMFCMHLNR